MPRFGSISRTPRPAELPTLGRGAADVLGSRPLRPFADVELDAITFPQIVDALAVNGTLVEEVVIPTIVLDESKTLVDPQRSNLSRHKSPPVRVMPRYFSCRARAGDADQCTHSHETRPFRLCLLLSAHSAGTADAISDSSTSGSAGLVTWRSKPAAYARR